MLRALAHPLRARMAAELAYGGPATATSLARRFGESTGLTSYHLRQLERFGFVEEVPNRGRGRERWWQSVRGDYRWAAGASSSAEIRLVSAELTRVAFDRDQEILRSYFANDERFRDWSDSVVMSNTALKLTRGELRELGERVLKILLSYRGPSDEGPSDAEPVVFLMYGVPWPGARRGGRRPRRV